MRNLSLQLKCLSFMRDTVIQMEGGASSGGMTSATQDMITPSGDGTRRADRMAATALFILVFLIFGARACSLYRPLTYLVGDCPYYAATAVSILDDHDLDLRNQ